MILDKNLEFADATSVAATAGTALIGNQIDLEVIGRDVGEGQPVYLVITVDTPIITAGVAGTVQFVLASDSTAAIATDGGATEHLYTPVYVTDDATASPFTAGSILYAGAIPAGVFKVTGNSNTYERYLGILCVTGTTETTAGAINAFLTLDPVTYTRYKDAQN